MKILWFTNTPSNASLEFGNNRFGGGWISSLESKISNVEGVSLALCFFYNGVKFKKLQKNNVIYYGIPLNNRNLFSKFISNHFGTLQDNDSPFFDFVLEDFLPDVIQIFGTENGYGKILKGKISKEKVVIHLQGLTMPYSKVYFPFGFNRVQVLINSNLKSFFLGTTYYNKYKSFLKRADREVDMIKYWKYFMGRTSWDKNYVLMTNNEALYFHCEEILRDPFYVNKWNGLDFPSNISSISEIVICTTINPNIYKGLDLIYKTLSKLSKFNIVWKIFGIEESDETNVLVKKMLKFTKNKTKIIFYGQQSEEELILHLKCCHFFVHPSYIDNSPNSVCEAMLLGIPVISSSVGGVNSLIVHNETGFLFNPYDEYELAGILFSLINNYKLAKDTSINARKIALIRHDINLSVNKIFFIYKNILNNGC
ncbi:hypothetical protein DR864_04390 [Runella rosea]|uniref:Glycosyl transferase family 1 domain-containing protein n=1 Tax=Runella rosea TaxID=2259595 RepID=A0A344TEF4_9BACT|nr:glycosyltransferase [Runella rosea]AXE17025.1 hypothetical protein DR864_04390 [Runella rosea]